MKTRTRILAVLMASGLALTGAACDDDVALDDTAQLDPDVDVDVDPDGDVDVDADLDEDPSDDSGDTGDGDADADADGPARVATGGALEVGDQAVEDGLFVTIPLARIDGGDGFVVIRADVDGQPGPVLGHATVEEGETVDLRIKLDQPIEGELDVFAVLHADADGDRMLDFPDGNDEPVEVDGQIVAEAFTLSRG